MELKEEKNEMQDAPQTKLKWLNLLNVVVDCTRIKKTTDDGLKITLCSGREFFFKLHFSLQFQQHFITIKKLISHGKILSHMLHESRSMLKIIIKNYKNKCAKILSKYLQHKLSEKLGENCVRKMRELL